MSDSNWTWVDGTIIPTVKNNGYDAKLSVDDKNYDYTNVQGYDSTTSSIVRTIALTVKKAIPKALTPTASEITYGDKLSDATLNEGWVWIDGAVVPTVQNNTFDAVKKVDNENYDYTDVSGYDSVTGTVTQTVTVIVNKAIPTMRNGMQATP